MARPRQVIILVVLILALMTTFAAMQGGSSYLRGSYGDASSNPGSESRSAPPAWPLAVAILIVAVLIVQEVRVKRVSALMDTARQTSSSSGQLMLTSDVQHSPGSSVTKKDLEVVLARAIDMAKATVGPVRAHPDEDHYLGSVRDSMGHGLPNLQRRAGVMTARKVCGMQKMLVQELESSLMTKIGHISSTFHAWRAEAIMTKSGRHFEHKLSVRQEEWDSHLAAERHRFQDEEVILKERNDLLHSRWGQKVSLLMEQWSFGEVTGLYLQAFRAWHVDAEREKKMRIETDRTTKIASCALSSLCKWIDGDAWGAAHTLLLHWKSEVWKSSADRALARSLHKKNDELAQERRRWEKLLEDQSRSHENDLELSKTEADVRKEKAHLATALMLAKWMQGDTKGLVSTILHEWKRIIDDNGYLKARRQTVHVAVLRFIDGDRMAAAHACFLNWKAFTKEQLVYKNEVAEAERKIVQLQERTRLVLGSAQGRLLKYSGLLASQDKTTWCTMVISAWRREAQGIRAAEFHRQQQEVLQEMGHKHQLAAARHKHQAAAVLHSLGVKDENLLLIDVFTGWSQIYQQQRAHWEHALRQNNMAEKYAAFLVQQFMTRDNESLLSSVFWEFTREMHRQIHERKRTEMRLEHEDLEKHLRRLRDDDVSRMQEELRLAYAQTDKITETLQRELKTKEELAEELHDACHKLREQSALINSRTDADFVEEVAALKGARRKSR